MQHHLLGGGRQLLEGGADLEAVMGGEALYHLEVELVAPVPALDGAGGQRKVREGDDAGGIEELDLAEAVAGGAGAHGVVEREQARLEFGQRIAADRAGELGREKMFD